MGNNQTVASTLISNEILNQNITNIIGNNKTNVNNVIEMSNTIRIENHGRITCKNFQTEQSNDANLNCAVSVTNEAVIDLKKELSTDVTNQARATNKLIQGFLAGIGQVNNTDMKMTLETIIHNVINTNVTINNINSILNSAKATNEYTLVNYGDITSDQCSIIQKNAVFLQSSTIIKNLVDTALSDNILTKVMNDAVQSNETQQKGLDDLISALTAPLAIIALGLIILVALTGREGVKDLTNWKLWSVVGIFGGVFLYIMYKNKVWVFKPKQYFACATDKKGFNTGYCKEITESESQEYINNNKQVFDSNESCTAAAGRGEACQKYYRCGLDPSGYYDGRVVECRGWTDDETDAKAGIICPYNNIFDTKNCSTFVYRCDQTEDDKGKTSASCTRINSGDVLPHDIVFRSESSKDAALASCEAVCKPL